MAWHGVESDVLRWVRKRIISWYRRHGSRYSWRTTKDPYKVFIAEMLLRRTTATAVSRVFDQFISRFPTVQTLAAAEECDITEIVSSLGLQNTRAKHLREAAQIIVQQFDGMIPDTETALKQLPGLGRYGVAAVLNFAFSIPRPMVDGNILHLFRRVFGLSFRSVDDEEAWLLAERLGGRRQPPELYWGMIDLVAQVCLRRRPRCEQCPLSSRCKYRQRGSATS